MAKQTSVQLPKTTRKQIASLAGYLGIADERHVTKVILYSVEQTLMVETAKRTLSDTEFVAFLAELYRPIT